MAVQGTNVDVGNILERATYGFKYEVIGDVRSNDHGEWRINGVPVNDSFGAIMKKFNGTAAVRILIAPVTSDFIAADNTLVQAEMPR